MNAVTCNDCQAPISDGATRCRACHREAWSTPLPPDEYQPPTPGRLYTGTELLARLWGKGDAR